MAYPPSKRLKSSSHNAAAFTDPFGDDDDFTQDDLEEIDILASQAVTGDTGGPSCSKATLPNNSTWAGEPSRSFSGGRKTSDHARTSQTRDGAYSNSRETLGFQCKDPFGNGHHSMAEKELSCSKLEAEQAELKKKLKELEEVILMKNGEIRVLRDSRRVAQQEKEQLRQTQLAREQEKAHAQSEREKEHSKEVQSLQSELQFNKAEMNEMKTKLKSSERGTKASPGTRNSPRAATSTALVHHTSGSSSSASPGGHAFITKETFAAQLPARSTPVKACGSREDGKQPSNRAPSDIRDTTHIDPFNCPTVQDHQGSVLLSLLLQHPLDPRSLGLCHLLCVSLDALQPARLQNTYFSSGSSVGSCSSSTETPRAVHKSPSRFSQLQSLAMSGLNVMSLPEYLTGQPPSSHSDPAWTNPNRRSCPGAVHLLPLLDYHIGLFCQTLEAMDSSGKSPLRESSLSGSSSQGSMASSMEDSLSNQEEFALASIRALYHVASQSREAVDVLLSSLHPQENATAGGEPQGPPQGTGRPGLTGLQENHTETGAGRASEPPPDRTREGLSLHHPLFRRLLQLSDPVFCCHAMKRECLVRSSLETLNVLAQRAGETHLCRFTCVLSSQAMMRCLSLDSSYQTVSLSVSLLAVLVNNDEVATKLCSHLDSCLFLKIFQYITSRPDQQVTERQWSQLEVEVVRFLTKLFTQKASTWGTFTESYCQCHSEVVQTVVVLLHRQWLDLRGREGEETQNQAQWTSSPGVHLLRECLTLLHWLQLNHSSFSEHCRPVLHMYDQIIPAVRDTFRRIPDLTDSEELALEEICRPEAEDTEDMDIDTCP